MVSWHVSGKYPVPDTYISIHHILPCWLEEVAAELGVSKSYAYKIVKQLNEELKKLGYLTVAGRVNTNYFRKKVCYSEM